MKKMKNDAKNEMRHNALGSAASRAVWAALAALSCAAPARQAVAQPLRAHVGGYELQVLAGGFPAPTFEHAGETYVLGQVGERYTLRVINRTGRRIEAVVSVDGRDVVDGRPGDFRNKRGYLVPAWGHVDIDGWRLSARQAAAFRFTSVADSYAARMGSARNVGVIGVAVFPERVYPPRRPQPITPWPQSRRGYRPPAADEAAEAAPEYAPRADAEGARPPATNSAKGKAAPAPSASGSASAPAEAARSRDGALAGAEPAPPRQRPGLGTEFGESVTSHVREVAFVRANPTVPSLVLGLRYNDRQGLVAMGVDVDGYWGYADDTALRRTAHPFPSSPRRYATPPAGWR
jgi:hypothetical protein